METIKISQDKLTFAADRLIKTRILGAFFLPRVTKEMSNNMKYTPSTSATMGLEEIGIPEEAGQGSPNAKQNSNTKVKLINLLVLFNLPMNNRFFILLSLNWLKSPVIQKRKLNAVCGFINFQCIILINVLIFL